MKLHFISRHGGDIRPGLATPDQIRDYLNPDSYSRSTQDLARVEMIDGEIVAMRLTEDELKALAEQLSQEEERRLRVALDHALALKRSTVGLGCAWTSGEPLVVWTESAPYAEGVVRQWATERGLHTHEDPMPASGKWYRTMYVKLGPERYDDSVVRLAWPPVEVGEAAVAVEVMSHAVASLTAVEAF